MNRDEQIICAVCAAVVEALYRRAQLYDGQGRQGGGRFGFGKKGGAKSTRKRYSNMPRGWEGGGVRKTGQKYEPSQREKDILAGGDWHKDQRQLISPPGGAKEWGRIPSESGLWDAPICLQKGFFQPRKPPAQDAGLGLRKLIEKHGDDLTKLGYADALDYVSDMAGSYHQIWRSDKMDQRSWEGTKYILTSKKHKGILVINFVEHPAGGGQPFYTVVTGGFPSHNLMKNATRIWTRP